MVKRNLLKEEFPELESSDVEINFDSYNTDFDKESDNICSESGVDGACFKSSPSSQPVCLLQDAQEAGR